MKEVGHYILDRSVDKKAYGHTFWFKAIRKIKFWIYAPYYYIEFERWICNVKKKELKREMSLLKFLGNRNPFIAAFAADRIAQKIAPVILSIIEEAPLFKSLFK